MSDKRIAVVGAGVFGSWVALLAVRSVSAARESAWRNAELLWHIRTLPPIYSAFLDTLDGLTTVVSKALMVPVP
jgi:hypothetical protein